MSASSSALAPEKISVSRSEFRQNLSTFLDKTAGNTVVVVKTGRGDVEKYVVDNQYFEELLKRLKAALETLEITSDPKLYARILRAAEHLQQDKLHSFEEAFE